MLALAVGGEAFAGAAVESTALNNVSIIDRRSQVIQRSQSL